MTIPTTGRVQVALNVTDLDRSVEFYRKLLGSEPAKRRPGYANFAVDSPPLKLVLIEGAAGGTINHLGVEVGDTEDVASAASRLEVEGLATDIEDGVACCYAVQDKVWVTAPDGEQWEYYTVTGDAPVMRASAPEGCCEAEGASVGS